MTRTPSGGWGDSPRLLGTKLRRPAAPGRSVTRPRLAKQLSAGFALGRQITLVSAPAGFGKTVCVGEWLNEVNVPFAWLSLDAADDDPGRFFSYFMAALQKIDPAFGQEIQPVLRAGQLPPPEVTYNSLINDLLSLPGASLLVLDDFQFLQDSYILDFFGTLIENLPLPLHLVLLTREDPPLALARLRANNQLTELRAEDLRFDSREAEQFMNHSMDLDLAAVEAEALVERTEGWIAGLQLAALAMKAPTLTSGRTAEKADQPARLLAALKGSSRYILSYLTEEVLNRQPEETRQFLLETSILDRLNGDLCRAVTGRSDSGQILERLYNANLFLIPLDDEGHWYRYHQLFAELLRDLQASLQKEHTAELHRRASRWYAKPGSQGSAGEGKYRYAIDAMRHALAGQDYAQAVQLLESYTLDMLMQWHIKTVETWMEGIPAAWSSQSTKANLAYAWMHLIRGSYPLAMPYLDRLQSIFAGEKPDIDPALQAEWMALQSTLLNAQGQPQQSIVLGEQALQIVPEGDVHVRSMIYLGLASAYQQQDDFEQSVRAYEKLILYGQAAGNLVSELLGISALGLLYIQRGQLSTASRLVLQGIERMERSGRLPPVSTGLYGEMGVVYYQRHQLELAHQHFQRAIQVSKLSGYSDAAAYYGVILSRLHHIEGNLDAARQEIEKTVALTRMEAPVAVREEVIAQQVRIYLAQDRLQEAQNVLGAQGFGFSGKFTYPPLDAQQNVDRPVSLLYLSALRTVLKGAQIQPVSGQEQARTQLDQAVEIAQHLLERARQREYLPLVLEIALLRSQMHTVRGEQHASQADLLLALELAEPEGFISPFLEEGAAIHHGLTALLEQARVGGVKGGNLISKAPFIQKILAAYPGGEREPAAAPAVKVGGKHDVLVEPLSQRELEILHLMEEGLSNQEIAERLVITLHTVKKHSSNLFSKLGVTSRTKAAAEARRLGLL